MSDSYYKSFDTNAMYSGQLPNGNYGNAQPGTCDHLCGTASEMPGGSSWTVNNNIVTHHPNDGSGLHYGTNIETGEKFSYSG